MNDLEAQLARAIKEKERSLYQGNGNIMALMGYADNAIEEALIKEKQYREFLDGKAIVAQKRASCLAWGIAQYVLIRKPANDKRVGERLVGGEKN